MPAAQADESSGNGTPLGAARPVTTSLRDARREARRTQRVVRRSLDEPAVATPPAKARLVEAPQPSVRHVRGVVRQIDLWSVFRCALLLYASMLVVGMVAFVVLWIAASATGARHSVEHFIASALLLKQFRFASATILLSTTAIGVVLVGMATGATVVLAAFYNLISDVVGGVEVTVLQEESSDPVV